MVAREPVAVVICCRDRAELLAESLAAMRTAIEPGDELIVADSASRDDSVRKAALAAGATVVRCDLPGASRARNAGWRASDKTVVLFTDDDCRPDAGWADAAAAALAEPGVGVVWGRVVASGEGGGVELSTTHDSAPVVGSLDGDLSTLGHGANMAARRETLLDIGGFDEVLGAGAPLVAAEDKDVFWRAMRAGWQVKLAPDMVVRHHQWRGGRESIGVTFRYGIGAGAVVEKRKRLGAGAGLTRGELWRHGLLPARRALRRGQLTAAAAALSRSAGVLVGRRRARRVPLRDAHYID